jgi:hypothetical protein
MFLYKEGNESDGGLILIGCGRVYHREVDETKISGRTRLNVGVN